jgi:hypothetical protein
MNLVAQNELSKDVDAGEIGFAIAVAVFVSASRQAGSSDC